VMGEGEIVALKVCRLYLLEFILQFPLHLIVYIHLFLVFLMNR
jgi:hypothetical protein